MVDLEDEMGEREKRKLERDVKEKGLSLVIFADWYSEDIMSQVMLVMNLRSKLQAFVANAYSMKSRLRAG